jgi:hypothetical protein
LDPTTRKERAMAGDRMDLASFVGKLLKETVLSPFCG